MYKLNGKYRNDNRRRRGGRWKVEPRMRVWKRPMRRSAPAVLKDQPRVIRSIDLRGLTLTSSGDASRSSFMSGYLILTRNAVYRSDAFAAVITHAEDDGSLSDDFEDDDDQWVSAADDDPDGQYVTDEESVVEEDAESHLSDDSDDDDCCPWTENVDPVGHSYRNPGGYADEEPEDHTVDVSDPDDRISNEDHHMTTEGSAERSKGYDYKSDDKNDVYCLSALKSENDVPDESSDKNPESNADLDPELYIDDSHEECCLGVAMAEDDDPDGNSVEGLKGSDYDAKGNVCCPGVMATKDDNPECDDSQVLGVDFVEDFEGVESIDADSYRGSCSMTTKYNDPQGYFDRDPEVSAHEHRHDSDTENDDSCLDGMMEIYDELCHYSEIDPFSDAKEDSECSANADLDGYKIEDFEKYDSHDEDKCRGSGSIKTGDVDSDRGSDIDPEGGVDEETESHNFDAVDDDCGLGGRISVSDDPDGHSDTDSKCNSVGDSEEFDSDDEDYYSEGSLHTDPDGEGEDLEGFPDEDSEEFNSDDEHDDGGSGGMSVGDIEMLPVRVVVDNGRPARCDICLLDFAGGESARALPCFHEFHQICIDQWLMIKPMCPTCRSVVCVNEWPEFL